MASRVWAMLLFARVNGLRVIRSQGNVKSGEPPLRRGNGELDPNKPILRRMLPTAIELRVWRAVSPCPRRLGALGGVGCVVELRSTTRHLLPAAAGPGRMGYLPLGAARDNAFAPGNEHALSALFTLERVPAKAVLSVAGLRQYTLSINGQPVTAPCGVGVTGSSPTSSRFPSVTRRRKPDCYYGLEQQRAADPVALPGYRGPAVEQR